MSDLWDVIGGGLFGRSYCSTDGERMVQKRNGSDYCPDCVSFLSRWKPGG